MRVAILSESAADEAALRILVDAVLGVKTTPVQNLPLRARGYHAVRDALEAIIKFVHFRTNADGLVVVVDSNHTSLATSTGPNRLREFRELIGKVQPGLRSRSGQPALRIAVGIASPAIEAWLLCRRDGQISEAAWELGIKNRQEPYSKLVLKQRVVGSQYWSGDMRLQKMTEAVTEVAADISELEKRFPLGFGSLAQYLRSWRRIT